MPFRSIIRDRIFTERSFYPRVALWGCGDFAETILEELNQIGTEVICFFDRYPDRFSGKNVLNVTDSSAIEKLVGEGIPLVITAKSARGVSVFSEIHRQLVCQFPGIKVLHPLALFPFVCSDLSEYRFINGFPGSGNTVFRNLINRASALRERSSEFEFWKKSAEDYNAWVEDCCHKMYGFMFSRKTSAPGGFKWVTSRNLDSADARFMNRESILAIRPVPFMDLIQRGYRLGHSFFEEVDYRWLSERKLDVYFILRHPLDVLVSLAAKVWNQNVWRGEVSSGGISREQRNILSQGHLNSEVWFKDYLEQCVVFQEEVVLKGNQFSLLRYEDLMEDPKKVVSEILKSLGLAPETNAVNELIDSTLMKPIVSTNRAHYNAPGCGKWKNLLGKKHYQWIYEVLGDEAEARFGSLGYATDLSILDTNEDSAVDSISDDIQGVNASRNAYSNCNLKDGEGKIVAEVTALNDELMGVAKLILNSSYYHEFYSTLGVEIENVDLRCEQ
ncbi:MAG: sulfotransferase domain-containing protein [Opitutales bacterium]